MRRRSPTRRSAGQTATEYLVVVSVIVAAVVAAAYLFVPEFQAGVAQLGADVSQMLGSGAVGGIGLDRGSFGGTFGGTISGRSSTLDGGARATNGFDQNTINSNGSSGKGTDSTAMPLGLPPNP